MTLTMTSLIPMVLTMTSWHKRRLYIDIETFSSVDIGKAGAFKYMEAPDFEILLVAYAWNDEPVRMIDLTNPFDVEAYEEMGDVVSGLLDPDTVKIAQILVSKFLILPAAILRG